MSETPVISVGPSLVRVVMTPLTKMLNPLVATLAGGVISRWPPRSITSGVAPARHT